MTGIDELLTACVKGDIKKVKYLVECKKVDLHYNCELPLQLAAEYGNLEVVKYLVSKGANIHADDDLALYYAVKNGYLEVVLYLRKVAGPKWKCYNCIVKVICMNLCSGTTYPPNLKI